MKLGGALSSLLLACLAGSAVGQGSLTSMKVSGENKSFEWFFLLAGCRVNTAEVLIARSQGVPVKVVAATSATPSPSSSPNRMARSTRLGRFPPARERR